MITERESAINAFIREPFYIPELDLGGFSVSGEKVKDKTVAENIRDLCNGKTATILSVQNQKKSIAPPRLFDLTTRQHDANRLLGFTAQQTLEYTQSLYEKKLITYPYADSRYLTSDMEHCIPALVRRINQTCPILVDKYDVIVNSAQVINNSKVSDHHAIIPTLVLGTADMNALPSGERDILNLVCVRLICVVADTHTYNEVVVTADCKSIVSRLKGKQLLSMDVKKNRW
jgi:DNA topoisomerase-3